MVVVHVGLDILANFAKANASKAILESIANKFANVKRDITQVVIQ